MKATIKIKQYDNGISLEWENVEEGDAKAIVALDREQSKAIGNIIWNDIMVFMARMSANVVNMAIEYLTEEAEE